MASNVIKMQGRVVKAHSTLEYDVELENGIIVNSRVSGKMRVHHIRILKGDKVDVEVSLYDLTRGRITFRHND
ncbi:MAG: translation initiation factor IF-1 [Mycoplasma sp.]|nr:translation initiation factor IF-1 [Mycoplasma sp.]